MKNNPPSFNIDNSSQPNLSDFSRRIHSHNKLQLIALFVILFSITLVGFGLLADKDQTPENILGVQSTTSQLTPTQSSDHYHCEINGGVVVIKTDTNGQKVSWCHLANGSECETLTYFQTGTCQLKTSTPTPSPQPVVIPSSPPLPTPVSQNIHVYQAQITRKPDTLDPIEPLLADYLETALGFRDQSPLQNRISQIAYDTRNGSPYQENSRHYFNYLILVIGQGISTPSTYEDYATIIRLQQSDPDLTDHLLDNNYCTSDTECTIRRNLCQYGAFNYFQTFVDAYQCNSIVDEFGDSIIYHDDKQSCKAEKVYADPRCINNKCLPAKEAGKCIGS